jgi:hypothetical protein
MVADKSPKGNSADLSGFRVQPASNSRKEVD